MALCRKPWITLQGDIAPCRKCPECLSNRKRLWTNRNILEGYEHAKKSFVTLTYNDENLPLNHLGFPTLEKEHLQAFFKNLRSKLEQRIRYYAVGEYGQSGGRGINPHFHVLLYGANKSEEQQIIDSWRLPTGQRGKKSDIAGFTYIGDITQASIQYVTGYVEKKTKQNQELWAELEIAPEFSTMSRRPAIGHIAITKLVDLFTKHPEYLTEYGDVPFSILHGDRSLPLGEYLREKIREELNLPHDIKTYMDEITGEITERKIWHGKEEAKAQKKAEMQILQENQKIYDPKLPRDAQVSVKQMYEYQNKQRQKQFDKKQSLKQNTHTL